MAQEWTSIAIRSDLSVEPWVGAARAPASHWTGFLGDGPTLDYEVVAVTSHCAFRSCVKHFRSDYDRIRSSTSNALRIRFVALRRASYLIEFDHIRFEYAS